MTAVSTTIAGSLRERATREYEREVEAAQAKWLAERNEAANLNLKGILRWLAELGIYDSDISVNDDATRAETVVDGVRLFYSTYLDDEWGWQTEMGVVVQCAKCRAPLYLPARDLVAIGHALSEPFEHGDYRALPRRFGVPVSCSDGDSVVREARESTQGPSVERALVQALHNFLNDWMDSR